MRGGSAGKLTLAKRNEQIVYCLSCSADGRDPFEGIYLRKGGFTVTNYGDGWRRYESYKFDYSRRDRIWRLVRVVIEIYRSFKPERVKTKILLPKNFGKINIEDFNKIALPY